jgi:threonine/homoserine/homoserine lactone efflux protein
MGLVQASCGVTVGVTFAADLDWTCAAAWARRWLRTPRAQCLANRVGATAMGGAAAAIATR